MLSVYKYLFILCRTNSLIDIFLLSERSMPGNVRLDFRVAKFETEERYFRHFTVAGPIQVNSAKKRTWKIQKTGTISSTKCQDNV